MSCLRTEFLELMIGAFLEVAARVYGLGDVPLRRCRGFTVEEAVKVGFKISSYGPYLLHLHSDGKCRGRSRHAAGGAREGGHEVLQEAVATIKKRLPFGKHGKGN